MVPRGRRATVSASCSAAPTAEGGLPAPKGVRANKLSAGGEEILVLSYPLAPPSIPETLTPAEREVVAGVLAGHSNMRIAELRRCSPSTVANQMASIFRKLGVASRAELLSVLFGSNGRSPDGGV